MTLCDDWCRTLHYDLRVGKQEHGVEILTSCHVVEFLQVFVEGDVIIASTQLYLETRVAAHV